MNTNTYENFQVQQDDRGVVTATLDMPGRPLNVLNQAAMSELARIVSEVEGSDNVRLLVLRSGKESGFLAGADVHLIADIQSAEQAASLIESGQQLFARLEALRVPTVAVIHGNCLGGGLELALACTYRIARENSSTQLGLPEIKLGIIPAWGGTQRLPRRVGLSTGVAMILKGQQVDARKALRIGLIDRAIDPADWDSGVDQFVNDLLAGKPLRKSSRQQPLWQRWMDGSRWGRWLILKQVRHEIAAKVEHYPALGSAVKAVSCGYQEGVDGFACEQHEFVNLLSTATFRNLIGIFFARERARQLKTWIGDSDQSVHQPPIRKVGVVGAGAMGAGIGQLAAYRGFDVVMKEIDQTALDAGRDRVNKLVDEIAKRKRMSGEQRRELTDRIAFSTEDQSLADCDLIVEAVVEREDIKHQVFAALDKVVKPAAILTSNTSSLSVTRMGEATERPRPVAGLHFFNPVHRMELVEVVRTPLTDEATIARLVTFVRALGKTPVVTTDSPGFLVNRVLFPYLGEAVLMASESFDVSMIDEEVRQFGMPMGPLELLDQVGIDVAHHVARSLDSVLPGVGRVVQTLEAMVTHGHLGKKSERGFYHYPAGKRGPAAEVVHQVGPPIRVPLNEEFHDDGLTPIQRRLIYPLLAEAIRCYEEGVVEQPWAIDLAMVLGTGFAPHRGGPLHLVDSIGRSAVLANLRRLQFYFDDRYDPPQKLIDMVEQGETFFQPGPIDEPVTQSAS